MSHRFKFFQSDEFKRLEKIWYDKLKKSGFHDHEKGSGGLIQPSNYAFRHHPTQNLRDARLNYYLFIAHGVQNESFESKRDQIIMQNRAEGFTIKDIAQKLSLEGFEVHRQTIRYIIRRYEKKWKIRHWRKDQLTSNLVTA